MPLIVRHGKNWVPVEDEAEQQADAEGSSANANAESTTDANAGQNASSDPNASTIPTESSAQPSTAQPTTSAEPSNPGPATGESTTTGIIPPHLRGPPNPLQIHGLRIPIVVPFPILPPRTAGPSVPPLPPTVSEDPVATMPGTFPDASSESSEHEEADTPEPVGPSPLDVLVVKAMLQRALRLPVEIVDGILDQADYWPHTSTVVSVGQNRDFIVSKPDENRFVLRTPPLGFVKAPHPDPRKYATEPAKPLPLSGEYPTEQFQHWTGAPEAPVQHPARKIVFTITSHDQGWGGDMNHHGTFAGSWTWFDPGLERVDTHSCCEDRCPAVRTSTTEPRPNICPCAMRAVIPGVVRTADGDAFTFDIALESRPDMIQCNHTASRDEETHVVEWRWDDNTSPDSPAADELSAAGRGRASANGEFVRGLKLGDAVTVWAKARFPGWANHVRSVKVDLYWMI